jgi:hypothetical protein
MADIYAGAWLVIAATQALDCAAGFLRPREKPLVMTSGQLGHNAPTVYARRTETHGCNLELTINQHPIFQRAWCMQERQLALRIVHFLPDEVLFRCRTITACECGASSARQEKGSTHSLPTSASVHVKLGQVTAGRSFAFGHAWAAIVKEYQCLRVTYLTDTLPALSGLARSMHTMDAGQYIAGLWENDIAYLLSWRLDVDIRPHRTKHRNPLATPTFSWITAKGAVT